MLKYLALIGFFILAGCSQKDRLTVVTNEDRVADLERRMALNEALDALQSQLITLNSDAINVLNQAVAEQSVVNTLVQSQVNSINSQLTTISNNLSSVQNQVDSNTGDINTLEGQVSSLQSSLSLLDLRLTSAESSLVDLQDQVNDLSDRLDVEGVTVYKCNSNSSDDRFLKINGKFYGTVSNVTTGTSSIVAASNPISVTVPKICANNGDNLKLPGNNGNCQGNGWTAVSGTGITTVIPAFTSSDVTVVISVQTALEELVSGQVHTTSDGTCSFNGDGTNLVQL